MECKIRVFPAGYLQTNAILISDPGSGQAVLVDAPHFVWDQTEAALKEDGCELTALYLTHGHYDHIGDAARIRARGVPLYGHEADRYLFEDPERMRPFVFPPDMELEGFEIDHWIKQGDRLEVLGLTCEVRHVPGHCPGNVLFYFQALGVALVGDAIFAGGIGRTDFPGGDFAMLEKSIREQIYTLPKSTHLIPGHGPTTTVGDEIETNPFVAGE